MSFIPFERRNNCGSPARSPRLGGSRARSRAARADDRGRCALDPQVLARHGKYLPRRHALDARHVQLRVARVARAQLVVGNLLGLVFDVGVVEHKRRLDAALGTRQFGCRDAVLLQLLHFRRNRLLYSRQILGGSVARTPKMPAS
jgi:hypothetical protein